MAIAERIFSLTDDAFSINGIAVIQKSVTPPTPFVCSHNMVLYQRLFYVVKGSIVFDDEHHRNLRFSAGDILYLPSNTVYKSYWDTAEEGAFLSLNFYLQDGEGRTLNLADDITLCCTDKSGRLYRLFVQAHDTWAKATAGYKLDCMAQLIGVMRELAAKAARQELGEENRAMLKAIFHLEDHYLEEVAIEELARIAHLKECQFRRKFKLLKGMSPVKYRNHLRLTKAAEMLRSGEYSVVETAMSVGFDDPNYFSRLFKEQFGQSPTQYIDRQLTHDR